ncbi:MAG TPA: amidohydrolase [Candidatus Limnocylindrales bacterium]|nr:amidohydrolase [Candidatus Limnocylindrales bacterium]
MEPRPADLVLTRGHVHTVDPALPRAEAIAVVGERIAAVGSVGEIARWTGPRTRVIDLAGRLLLPGFQDAHVHPVYGGMDLTECDVREARGREEVIEAVRAYAEAHPDKPWIIGSGWYMADFPNGTPRREDLDAIVPDRPVFLPNRDGHSAWVNTRALELAGIDDSTPDPPDGRIERDPDGTPTGTLHEGAGDLVERLLPKHTEDEWLDAFRTGQAYLHGLGITAWQDAIVPPEFVAIYRRTAETGLLTARVEGALWWERDQGPEQVEAFVEVSRSIAPGRFRANSVKLMLDGVVETYTASMVDPYLGADGTPTANRGIDFIDPVALCDIVTRLDAAGLQAHFHALGDGAVRHALDAVEAARQSNGLSDTRPHLAHIQVVHPDDLPRFARLGAVGNAQPLWACQEAQMNELTIPFLGDERSTWQYPFGSLLRSGARVAMGSDWAVSTPNPLLEIEVAVERVWPESRGELAPFLPRERLTLEQAIHAFTMGSAYVNHLDDSTGSVSVGKLADLAIVDRDLFAPDAGPIGDARVLGTFVGGASVFEDSALG